MAFYRCGGGSGATVTIDGSEVTDNLNLTKHYSDVRASVLPYEATSSRAVVYNNEIHIFGNGTNHYKWDGTSWTSVSTLPFGFYNTTSGAVVYNNEIHIFGNGTNHYKWDGTSWTRVSTLPFDFSSYNCEAVIYNGNIHLVAGKDGGGHYSWDGSSWKSYGFPSYLSGFNVVVYNEKMHIIGNTAHYSFNGTSWNRSVSTLPYAFWRGSAVVYNNEIHILGGYNSGDGTKHYKWDGTSWTSVSTLPYFFRYGSAVVYNNEIHILGDYDGNDKRHCPYNHFILNTEVYRKVA